MYDFSTMTWLLLASVGGSAVLAFLYMAAALVRNEVTLHDLRVEVARLRLEYHRKREGLAAPHETSQAERPDSQSEAQTPEAPAETRRAA